MAIRSGGRNVHPGLFGRNRRRAGRDFHALGFTWLQPHTMGRRNGFLDRAVERIAADANGFESEHLPLRDGGHVGGAGAQIDNQDSLRRRHRDAGADRSGHGLVNQIGALGPRMHGGFQHCPPLDAGHHRGHR